MDAWPSKDDAHAAWMQQQFATYKDWMWSGRERGAVKTSVRPELNQGHSDLCGLYSQVLCQLSYGR